MLKRLTADDVRERSLLLGLDIGEDELDEYVAMTGTILSVIEGVDTSAARNATVAAGSPDVLRRVDHVMEPERAGRDPLNAIVRFCSVKAVAPAGPLTGRHVVMKDSFAVAGVPMTCGSRLLQGFTPGLDSTVAARLLAAGAEIVGISNMEDMAFSGGGESSFYGPIANPVDRRRIAGGSSGGSAAALAYPWVDIGIGTDQGGSIRIPAAFCGVLGLKPTHGLVPYTGGVGIDRTIDHVGPLTRSAADLATTMAVIAGPDGDDPRQLGHDFSQVLPGLEAVASGSASLELAGLRVGLVAEGWGEAAGVEPAVDAAVREALGRLASLGAELVDVSVPWHARIGGPAFAMFAEGLVNALAGAGTGMGSSGRYWPELATALGRGVASGAGDLSPQVKGTLLVGTMLREQYFHHTYAHAMNLRREATAELDAVLETVDVLAMPTCPFPAYEIDPSLGPNDSVWRGWSMLPNTPMADMTGHPSLSLPTSTVDGLPVGTMLTGRRMADHELVRIAAAYERAYGWELGAKGDVAG